MKTMKKKDLYAIGAFLLIWAAFLYYWDIFSNNSIIINWFQNLLK